MILWSQQKISSAVALTRFAQPTAAATAVEIFLQNLSFWVTIRSGKRTNE
jgi:hypothetical protein